MQKHCQKPGLMAPFQKSHFAHASSPPFLTCFSLFPCFSCCCCSNYQSGTDLQLWSFSSLHWYKRSDLKGPSVIPLSEKDLPEDLKWCNWLPVLPTMSGVGQAIHEGFTHPLKENKAEWTWYHLRSKRCRCWAALMFQHGAEQTFNSIWAASEEKALGRPHHSL